jgi:Na+/H+ antiporter NhaD/arsenite permease-like protein
MRLTLPHRWNARQRKHLAVLALLGVAIIAAILMGGEGAPPARAQDDNTATLTGEVLDPQGQPVCQAEVYLYVNGATDPAASAPTNCETGGFVLDFTMTDDADSLLVEVERPHFVLAEWEADETALRRFNNGQAVRVPTFDLRRRITIAFWVAAATFLAVLLLIALDVMHSTLAALMGVAIVLIASTAGRIAPGLFIFDFERALSYVDFEVIFLVMGMMIVIAAVEETGIFQWVTYQAYRLSGGRVWLLVTILMFFTAIASALLDNVTTMLLMAPLTIQIALAMGINPLSLLIPEVMASNVGGIATLIGTPTNILIGSYAGLGFNDFLLNLTPGVLLAQLALITFVVLRYRPGWQKAGSGEISEALLKRLEEAAEIEDPIKLRKAGIVFVLTILGFVFGETLHVAPAVMALVGAVLMLLWVAPDIETMMQVVDWTTLMFFIALFILVGAIQEVGVLSVIAGAISRVVGESVIAAMLVLIWSGAILSGVVANIPFTAAMLPVVQFLSRTVPGADSNVLYYSLSVGSAMGGNSSLIGASANMVTAGISERAGYRITYMDFLKVGLPATAITVICGTGWLLLHFIVFG